MNHDLVRPFVMTGGRTKAAHHDMRLETLLRATGPATTGLSTEQIAMVHLCQEPQSVAELAARLSLVVGVATIVASDLVGLGLLEVHHTDPVDIELDALTRMIERVRAI